MTSILHYRLSAICKFAILFMVYLSVDFFAVELLWSCFAFEVWNQPTSEWMAGFHLQVKSCIHFKGWKQHLRIPAECMHRLRTNIIICLWVCECYLFLKIIFAISNHRITYNSMLETSYKQRLSQKVLIATKLVWRKNSEFNVYSSEKNIPV